MRQNWPANRIAQPQAACPRQGHTLASYASAFYYYFYYPYTIRGTRCCTEG
jgi:hypothetical protein